MNNIVQHNSCLHKLLYVVTQNLVPEFCHQIWIRGRNFIYSHWDSRTYTVQEGIDHGGMGTGTIVLSLICLVCPMIEGVEYTALGIIIPKLRCEWSLSSLQVAIIPVVIFLSATAGAMFGSHIIGQFGRLYCIIVPIFLSSIAAIASAMAGSFVHFLIVRGITVALLKIGNGAVTLYLLEYSPINVRAHLIACVTLSFYGGRNGLP